MAEPTLNALVDEHIALLAGARQERDQHKQQVVDLSHALLHEQMANADLVAALETAPAPVSNPSPTYIDRWERWFIDVRLRAIAKAKDT